MKRIKIMAVVITVLSFNSVRSELPSSIQNTLMDLSGVISITNIPKLETTVQRNQFFDNYSVLSMPDIEVNDQIQLQNIQTFSPSHRKVGLEALNQIKDITSGLVLQDVTVTPEDFKDIGMQDGKIVVPNIADKSQQVKDILEATNTVLQEVKSLNKKELNSLKLTISDMRDIQKITPIIQQQLSGAIVKDGKVNGVSIDIDAMGADLKDILKGTPDLFVNMTFADFDQMRDMRSNPDGSLIMPNYNRETASDNLNKFVDQSERISTYVGTGVLVLPAIEPQALPEFPMKGFDTITGKQNGFLNIVPELGSVASSFQVSDFTQNNPATFSWNNQSAGQLLNTENGFLVLIYQALMLI